MKEMLNKQMLIDNVMNVELILQMQENLILNQNIEEYNYEWIETVEWYFVVGDMDYVIPLLMMELWYYHWYIQWNS